MKLIHLGSGRASQRRKVRSVLLKGGTTSLALLFVTFCLIALPDSKVAAKNSGDPSMLDPKLALTTVKLVTTVVAIPRGTRLAKEHLQEIDWPRDQVPDRAIRYLQDAKEQFASANLTAGQPITRASLSSTPPMGGLTETLPPGFRAVTIQVNDVSGVEGWATPGAHVDVLLTYLDGEDSNTTKTLMAVENATVLSYNGSARPVTTGEKSAVKGKTAQISTATLAVPMQEALKIQTARAVGNITLILRNTNDMLGVPSPIFRSNEWDKDSAKPKLAAKKPHADGFARLLDDEGKALEFRMGAKGWQRMDEVEG